MSRSGNVPAFPNFENLSGTWESPEVEPIPGSEGKGTFITRTFDFDGDAWRVRFSGWTDQQRKHRLFDGVAEGHFQLEGPWAAVPGALAAIFHFDRRLFTVHTRALAQQLTKAGAGNGHWAPGIQQDVSKTGALFLPSVAKSSAEYDLLAFDSGPKGERDLYLGDRSHEMSTPANRPVKRIPFPVRKVD
jgi:hypothetical protein